MMTFASRRRRNVLIAAIVAIAIVAVHRLYFTASLVQTSYWTGWTLLSLMLVLAAYNLRKKMPFLPLGTSAAWLQLHIYVGLLTIVLFVAHVGYAVPNGRLEQLLALLYVLVAGSGVVGLFFTRFLPPRLNRRGENVMYDRIPVVRRRIHAEAERLVFDSVKDGNVTTISDFYRQHLVHFMEAPRNFWSHLVGSTRPRHALLTQMNDLTRYLDQSDRSDLEQLAALVRTKDDLDYRHMGLSVLRWWLFVHIPLTYGLLVVALVHLVLVHAFAGGSR